MPALKSLLPLAVLLLLGTCKSRDAAPPAAETSDCGQPIRVRHPLPRLTSDFFRVADASVEGLCLSVTVAATGCGSEGWSAALHTDGLVAESSPTQTQALLVFDDGVGEDGITCQAIVEQTFTFDLSPYLTEASLPTVFRLTGTEITLTIKR